VTDVISLMDRYLIARRNLDHERAARQQAEDRLAEQQVLTERAETRCEEISNDRDGWRGLAAAFANERIDQYAGDELSDLKRDRVVDAIFYDHWSITGQLDGIPVEGLVNDALEDKS
jgi:lipase chaperone LimK